MNCWCCDFIAQTVSIFAMYIRNELMRTNHLCNLFSTANELFSVFEFLNFARLLFGHSNQFHDFVCEWNVFWAMADGFYIELFEWNLFFYWFIACNLTDFLFKIHFLNDWNWTDFLNEVSLIYWLKFDGFTYWNFD